MSNDEKTEKPLTISAMRLRAELIARSYAKGYSAGVIQAAFGKRGRHVVESDTHEYWRRGFEDGRKAIEKVTDQVRQEVLGAQAKKTV